MTDSASVAVKKLRFNIGIRLTSSMLPSFPSRLRCMCTCLHKLIGQLCYANQTEQANTVLSTIVFLRFVNPAVVSPYESGLLDFEPPARVKRGLTLVGKMMQNIANQLLFTKESHMRVFDAFLKKHFDSCRRFFQVSVSETWYAHFCKVYQGSKNVSFFLQ